MICLVQHIKRFWKQEGGLWSAQTPVAKQITHIPLVRFVLKIVVSSPLEAHKPIRCCETSLIAFFKKYSSISDQTDFNIKDPEQKQGGIFKWFGLV